jgi:hypothetical protein
MVTVIELLHPRWGAHHGAGPVAEPWWGARPCGNGPLGVAARPGALATVAVHDAWPGGPPGDHAAPPRHPVRLSVPARHITNAIRTETIAGSPAVAGLDAAPRPFQQHDLRHDRGLLGLQATLNDDGVTYGFCGPTLRELIATQHAATTSKQEHTMTTRTDALHDALDRLAGYGYTDGVGFACHGPMGAEALGALGYADHVPDWVQAYAAKHPPIDAPPPSGRIDPHDPAM